MIGVLLNEEGKVYRVYGLLCPHTDLVMYVGVTTRPLKTRLRNHVSQSGYTGSVLGKWIKGLTASGKRPKIVALPFESEVDAIGHYGIESLLNARRGGGGRAKASAKWSPEILARLGREPDRVLARELNVSPDAVGKYRRKLGILAYKWRGDERRKRREPGGDPDGNAKREDRPPVKGRAAGTKRDRSKGDQSEDDQSKGKRGRDRRFA